MQTFSKGNRKGLSHDGDKSQKHGEKLLNNLLITY